MPNSAADQQRVQEGATFSLDSYGNPPTLPPGWDPQSTETEIITTDSGYQARVYIDRNAQRVFFADTGTNDLSDVKSWPDALFGPRSQQFRDMLVASNEVNSRLGVGGDLQGYTIDTAGHSWGELMAQIQTYVFGWRGVGFDGPGAALVTNDSRFSQILQELNITAAHGTDFISCNTAGLGPFGGGVVGSIGSDIDGTRQCTVTLESSMDSGVINLLIAALFAAPTGIPALGLLGLAVGKLVTGVLQHDMGGINQAVQNGAFEVAPDSQTIPKAQPQSSILEPFIIDDGEGKVLSTLTDSSGQVITDANGLPTFSLKINSGTPAEITFLTNSSGQVLEASTPQLNPNDPITNSFTLITRTTDEALSQAGAETEGQGAALVNGGTVLGGPTATEQVTYNDPTALNNDTADNTAAAAATRILANDERPGNNNIAAAAIDEAALQLLEGADPALVDIVAATTNNAALLAAVSVPTDPLVLDLNGDGAHFTSYTDKQVLFDIDHDGGSLEQTGWVSTQDGIVVQDLNSDGIINSSAEMLSEYYNGTVGTGGNPGSKPFANGFAALKSLDSNNDNVFNSTDAAWNNLRVWVDANSDGKTDAGELKTFAQLGITQINLTSTTQSGLVRDGNEVLASGTFVQSGQTKEALAANFLANPNGHIFTANGNGTLITTQGGVTSYVTHSATGEVIDVAAKGVKDAYGGQGNDTLIGDAGNNWLAGGPGSDTFNAGAGDDVLLIDANDLQANIHAGAGLDIVHVVGDTGVILNLAQAEVEIAEGGRGDDTERFWWREAA